MLITTDGRRSPYNVFVMYGFVCVGILYVIPCLIGQLIYTLVLVLGLLLYFLC